MITPGNLKQHLLKKNINAKDNINTGIITEDRRQHFLQQVCNHVSQEPFSADLLEFIGGVLDGDVCCKYSHKPMYCCNVLNIPDECPAALREFVQDGVYSVPCGFYDSCRNWICFRLAEFCTNDSMRIHWERHNWNRKGMKGRYFSCPACLATFSKVL